MELTHEDIDKRYDALIAAFKELAEAENEYSALKTEILEYGDSKAKVVSKLRDKLGEMKPKMNLLSQAYKLADFEVGRIIQHIQYEKALANLQ